MNKHRKLNAPDPIVTIRKRFGHEVMVGIVDANRMLAHGFDVDYPADIHFRTVRHGAFAVLVGVKQPVEVRILMDGKLLAEQRLDPLPQPSNRHLPGGSEVRKQVRELIDQPQPFFITTQNDHSRLMFTADPQLRSADERLALQLYPKSMEPGPAITMHMGGDVAEGRSEAVFDVDPNITPEQLGLIPAVAQEEGDVSQDESQGEQAQPENKPATVDETGVVQPSDYRIDAPLPERWAPSYGLVAVGVRMVQVPTEGEPMLPPDGFEYVLFQLNTWEDHCRVRANLHSRIKFSERASYREIDDGRGDDYNPGDFGCGQSIGHDPRRFR